MIGVNLRLCGGSFSFFYPAMQDLGTIALKPRPRLLNDHENNLSLQLLVKTGGVFRSKNFRFIERHERKRHDQLKKIGRKIQKHI
jgi:hypothetical protein